MSRKLEIALITIVVLVIYAIGGYFVVQDSKVCDERVFLKDGTTIDCTRASSFDNGMTQIRTCKGEKMQIPTVTITKIKEIKTK
jgi:hypothetical protein